MPARRRDGGRRIGVWRRLRPWLARADTLPTDHIYFYHRLRHPSAPSYDVLAPAGGIVREARRGNDDMLRVQVTATQTYYLAHIHLDAAIHDGMVVAAGQRVGILRTGYRARGPWGHAVLREPRSILPSLSPASETPTGFTAAALTYVR